MTSASSLPRATRRALRSAKEGGSKNTSVARGILRLISIAPCQSISRQNIAPVVFQFFDLGARGAVAPAMHRRRFDKIARRQHPIKSRVVDEKIIAPFRLAGARRAGGVRDGGGDGAVGLHQPRQRGLAGAGGAAKDKQPRAHWPRANNRGAPLRRAVGAQAAVDRRRAFAAFADRPNDERLPAPHIAARENPRPRRFVFARFDIAARVQVEP